VRVLVFARTRLESDLIEVAISARERVQAASRATSLEEVSEAVQRLRPDVALIATSLRYALSSVRELQQRVPSCVIVALGVSPHVSEIMSWASVGASGCVGFNDTIDDALAIIRAASSGQYLCSSSLSSALFRRHSRASVQSHTHSISAPLTVRESLILSLVAEGFANKEIASQLQIELATVKNHLHRIFVKLGVHRRTDAVRTALDREIL
jgi:two-component system, NarL family, nitrate/nitrite response regulator NarL